MSTPVQGYKKRALYPDYVPIIIQTDPTDLTLRKTRFMVPKTRTIGWLMQYLRSRNPTIVTANDALFFFVGNTIPCSSSSIDIIDCEHRDQKTGILYLSVRRENTFGAGFSDGGAYFRVLPLKALMAKLVARTKKWSLQPGDGEFPRVGWVYRDGRRVEHAQYYLTPINKSPHFLFATGYEQRYADYMNTRGWVAGYGPEHGVRQFSELQKTFRAYDPARGLIKVVHEQHNGHAYIAILDGLHRASILYARDPDQLVRVQFVRDRGFLRLPKANKYIVN